MSTLHPHPPTPEVTPRPLADLVAPVRAAGLLAADVGARDAETVIRGLTDDSRRVQPGFLFGAISPDTEAGRDGHDYVPAALAAGASAALVHADYHLPEAAASAPEPLGKGERLPSAVLVRTTDSRAALAEASAAFFGRPGDALALLGITGTNGKTTTAILLHGLLARLGETAGLIGTVENRIGAERYATAYTTPEAIGLQSLLASMRDRGATHVAMEVSSHGLALDRVRTLNFRSAVFTNLTHDHLDFHKTVEDYMAAKRTLFTGLQPDAVAIVNADDPAHAEMTRETRARVVTFGTAPGAHIRVEVLENAVAGLLLRLDGHERRFKLAGRFNALNLAAAYAVARDLGYAAAETLDALTEAEGVPGRFQTVRSADGVLGVVDYAHTPDALDNVLATAREIVPEGRALWAVFGCGGDRDRTKRPEMGRIATERADRVVVTSDNPRTEDPEAIVRDIVAGMPGVSRLGAEAGRPEAYEVVVDRAAAIAHAATEADPGDVIVVAGKGHEDYQIVGTEKRDFDDRLHLGAAFARRAGGGGQSPVAGAASYSQTNADSPVASPLPSGEGQGEGAGEHTDRQSGEGSAAGPSPFPTGP
ncbi:MAG: UDP-N-acetylmuramoyl-L-alanyl-D-glutamate--2,6-diaminopimelate ligase [Bacteroidota bacterium]